MEERHYDVAVIGGGSAAFAAAIRARAHQARIAVIERDTFGGTCVNVGCIPSKHLLAASGAYRSAGHHPFDGVLTSQDGIDMRTLVAAKARVVSEMRQEKYVDLAAEYGFDLIEGSARFTGPDRLEVDGREISFGTSLIATGAAPWTPPIPGLADAGYLTSTSAMALTDLPATLVIIGGNAIGLELGQVFANLGARVTLVEILDRIAPSEEPEISEAMTRILREDGIEVVTSADVIEVRAGAPKTVVARIGGAEHRLEADEILVATGRRPALGGLSLTRAGVEVDERGGLVLDPHLRTTNERIFAAGDATGSPQFVYVAAAQGTLAVDNAISDARREVDYTALPRVTFTDPSIASVGLSEAQALAGGHAADARVLELGHVPRARVNLDVRGLFKIVADRSSRRVLGVHVLAQNAGEVILAGVYAVKFGLTTDDVAGTWAPYLTMAEGLRLGAQTFSRDVSKLSCCAA